MSRAIDAIKDVINERETGRRPVPGTRYQYPVPSTQYCPSVRFTALPRPRPRSAQRVLFRLFLIFFHYFFLSFRRLFFSSSFRVLHTHLLYSLHQTYICIFDLLPVFFYHFNLLHNIQEKNIFFIMYIVVVTNEVSRKLFYNIHIYLQFPYQ